MSRPRIGLALGSGAARGWAHIGAVHALTEAGVAPDVVCGTSIGALVGAAIACGRLAEFEAWVRALTRLDILRYMDFRVTGGGLIHGERLMEQLRRQVEDARIEELPVQFACVATELRTGRELWFQDGPLVEAVRASLALPGLLTPARHGGEWLVDGGLVNPVPVSVCRALGADTVIAINLNSDIVGRRSRRAVVPIDEARLLKEEARVSGFRESVSELRERAASLVAQLWPEEQPEERTGMFDVIAGALNIMQDRITRSRMAGDPPDVVIVPRMAHIGLLEFDRAAEAIREGREAVHRTLPAIRHMLAEA